MINHTNQKQIISTTNKNKHIQNTTTIKTNKQKQTVTQTSKQTIKHKHTKHHEATRYIYIYNIKHKNNIHIYIHNKPHTHNDITGINQTTTNKRTHH